VYLSIHPEVDYWIAAGVKEGKEENDGVDGSMVVQQNNGISKGVWHTFLFIQK
jgi:hypothetical protein